MGRQAPRRIDERIQEVAAGDQILALPPTALATLAGYLSDEDKVTIQDEHVERLDVSDEPDLVAIEVYITSAYRAYELGDHYRRRGAHVALGGLHQRLAAQGRITAANWDLYS